MGWTFRWVSSNGSDFNYHYSTSFTEDQQASGTIDYNYGPQDTTWLGGRRKRSGPWSTRR